MKNLVVRGGRFITGRSGDRNGEGNLPFTGSEIRSIRRHSVLPFIG